MARYKHRYKPYQVLVLLLSRLVEGVLYDGNRVKFRMAPTARCLRLSQDYMKRYLKWLNERGYIEDLVLSEGKGRISPYVTLTLVDSPMWEERVNDDD